LQYSRSAAPCWYSPCSITSPGAGGGLDQSGVEALLAASGYMKADPIINVGAGGQTIFVTASEIKGDFVFLEDGSENIVRVKNKTGPKEITTTTSVPQGTAVRILY